MKKLVGLVNENPWGAEVGLGGNYKSYEGSVTKRLPSTTTVGRTSTSVLKSGG